jgi:hypothetical protein
MWESASLNQSLCRMSCARTASGDTSGATKLKENLRFLEESPERPALADHFLIEREFTARQ